jgi:hypothetical protein
MSELLKHPGESSNDNLTAEGKAAAHTRRAFVECPIFCAVG